MKSFYLKCFHLRKTPCLTNLLESLETWTKALDEVYGLDIVYLDFRKALDSMPHIGLVEKLKMYGLKGEILIWIEDFLRSIKNYDNRIKSFFSRLIEVFSSVPQSSVLGP